MADRAAKTIDELCARRTANNNAGTNVFLAPNTTYGIGADPTLAPDVVAGPTDTIAAIGDLIYVFEFHKYERI